MVERWKTEAMAMRCQRARKGISLFIEEEENHENNIEDKTDPDQASNDKNLLQLWEKRVGKSCKQQFN